MSELAGFRVLISASTWVLTCGLHGAVAHGIALLAGRTVVRSPRHRSVLWKAALLLPFATATIATAGWRPMTSVGDLSVVDLVRRGSSPAEQHYWVERRAVGLIGEPLRATSFGTDTFALDFATVLVAFAAVAMLLGFGRLAWRRHGFRRRLGERTTLSVCDGEPVVGYRLTASATLGVPVALGRSEICVPGATFASLRAVERRSVLSHEAEHLRRRDPFWFALADLVVAAQPWQPLVRLVVRQLRRDAEYCCDDAVVRSLGDGASLLRALAVFAAPFDPAEIALAASCGGSPLEKRARRILGPVERVGPGSAVGLVIALSLLIAGVAVAAPALSTRATAVRPPPSIEGPGRTIRLDTEVVTIIRR